MSFLKNMFGKPEASESVSKVGWRQLTDLGQLNEIINESTEKPVAIFKHSTTCGISRMAWNLFQKNYNISDDQMSFYYLDLLAYRGISNEVASRFGVQHQSPQLIVIKDGKVVYNASHENIDASQLEKFI